MSHRNFETNSLTLNEKGSENKLGGESFGTTDDQSKDELEEDHSGRAHAMSSKIRFDSGTGSVCKGQGDFADEVKDDDDESVSSASSSDSEDFP